MPETFADVLQRLYLTKYTGPMTVQFGEGVPSVVEFPQKPVAIRLDKPPRLRQDLTRSGTVAPPPRDSHP